MKIIGLPVSSFNVMLLLRRNNKIMLNEDLYYYRHASRIAVFYKKTGVPRGAFYIIFTFTQDSYLEQV